jgi:two-component system, NtrC family, response regulator HydG
MAARGTRGQDAGMSDTPRPPPVTAFVSKATPAAAPPPALADWLDALPEPHIVFDRSYRIVAANAAYRSQFAPAGSVIGRTCYEVSHRFSVPCDQAGESCPLARARVSGQRERVLHLHHTPRGEEYVSIELVPLRAGGDAAAEPQWFIERMEAMRGGDRSPGGNGSAGAPGGLIGRSLPFRRMLELVARVGPSDASVLLVGESGTGKELVARALHEASARASRALVVVDCASLPETLFESELFGHERGAFTGAHATRPGLVESAAGGTLFLDEVGDVPLAMQVKLLRLLESGTYRRVGSTELRHADVRLVSATHRNLRAMIAEGRFREDLYHRLSTFPIVLPPLRERREDIPLLARALLARVAPTRGLSLAPQALALLARHPFPGNVRELRNVIERAALLTDGELIQPDTITQALGAGQPWAAGTGADAPEPAAGGPRNALRAGELAALRAALASHPGDRRALAEALGVSLRTLYRKLKLLERAGA